MFARFVTLLPLAALVAVATAAEAPAATCSSGSVYCCNQKFSNSSTFEKKDPVGVIDVLLGLGVNVGVQCSPITVIGALSNGAQCTKQTACCKDVKQNGLVNFSCAPVAAPV
ncbi:fungal hydrophobin-domain-containing protein [Boletus edulis BED1]|uniref:Hydrophobin n=1 Tax=Boletus edulis BED1 TaxID=1328754 RepID=A0AAD4GDK8_BOLED|nr:fungal hydrophobin-domain-containing protein [Boletus edulis BED1]